MEIHLHFMQHQTLLLGTKLNNTLYSFLALKIIFKNAALFINNNNNNNNKNEQLLIAISCNKLCFQEKVNQGLLRNWKKVLFDVLCLHLFTGYLA